jgi:hypothetical protein
MCDVMCVSGSAADAQAMWETDSPLLQLPHVTRALAAELKAKSYPVGGCSSRCCLTLLITGWRRVDRV